MRFVRFWLVPAVILAALTGCEYSGPPEGQAKPSAPPTTAPRNLDTDQARGVDFLMNPADGAAGRYAFRPVPASPELATAMLQGADGLKVVVHSGQPSASGPEAELRGTLAKDGAGCVILQSEAGDDYTLIFPEGTSLDGETLLLPAGPRLAIRDPVALTGNRVPADESLSMCLNYARLYSVESAATIP